MTIREAAAALVCAAAVLVAGASVARAAALPQNKCLAGKFKAVAKSAVARANCLRKDASAGVADPACLTTASSKFTDATKGPFAVLEAKIPNTSTTPCLTYADDAEEGGLRAA